MPKPTKKAKPQPKYRYLVPEHGSYPVEKYRSFNTAEAADAYAVAMSLANNDGGIGRSIPVQRYKRTSTRAGFPRWHRAQLIAVRATILSPSR